MRRSLILAGLGHLAILIAMLVQFSFSSEDKHNTLVINPQVNIIEAVAVSENELKSEMQRLENLEKKKRDAELAEERALQEAQEKIVKAREAEQKRLVEAKKQQELAERKKIADAAKAKVDAERAAQQKVAAAKTAADKAAADKAAAEKLAVAKAAKDAKDAKAAKEAQAQAAAASSEALREIERYKAMVRQQIMRYWVVQGGLKKDEPTKLFVRVAPTGTVLDVKVVQSSGNEALDRSAVTAVYKASPLPVPQDPELFRSFRELRLTLRPDSILSEG
jgi:colicin import membrane protein